MTVNPYNDEEQKVSQVQRMFNRIAPTYDKLNRIISLGLDNSWRQRAIELLAPFQPKELLDIATGTGDLAIDLVRTIPSIKSIIGADISAEMMRYGQEKVRNLGMEEIISFQQEDCTNLSFPDKSFDAVTIAFGIRNFEDIPQSAKELYRVLRPGKPVVILELTEPKNKILKLGYDFYTSKFIPWVGRKISDDDNAYDYLPKSIAAAPQREAMLQIFKEVGFTETYYKSLFPGTCTIYVAIK